MIASPVARAAMCLTILATRRTDMVLPARAPMLAPGGHDHFGAFMLWNLAYSPGVSLLPRAATQGPSELPCVRTGTLYRGFQQCAHFLPCRVATKNSCASSGWTAGLSLACRSHAASTACFAMWDGGRLVWSSYRDRGAKSSSSPMLGTCLGNSKCCYGASRCMPTIYARQRAWGTAPHSAVFRTAVYIVSGASCNFARTCCHKIRPRFASKRLEFSSMKVSGCSSAIRCATCTGIWERRSFSAAPLPSGAKP